MAGVVVEVKDFGGTVDSRLTFDVHIRQTVAQAFVRDYLKYKYFVSRDIFTLLRSSNVYVKPLAEHASHVWSPHSVNQVKLIEAVQQSSPKDLLVTPHRAKKIVYCVFCVHLKFRRVHFIAHNA